MKPKIWLLPIGIAIAAACWIVPQRRSISALEKENERLQARIAAHSAGVPLSSSDLIAARNASPSNDIGKIDWAKTAADITAMHRSSAKSGFLELLRFQQRVEKMTPAEILSALDEISSLDLSDDLRNAVELELFSSLAWKDPQLMLFRFIDQIRDQRRSAAWVLPVAMENWAKRDLAGAIEWFDQQIAAGTFDSKALDGRNLPRMPFERRLISVLLSSDLDAAARRLSAIPLNERQSLLSSQGDSIAEKDHLAFANLVRSQLPEKQQAGAIASLMRISAQGDYLQINDYMDRIEATSTERVHLVEKAAMSTIGSLSHERKITLKDIDHMRNWGATHAPEAIDRATGKALANAAQNSRKTSFMEAADLAVYYQDANPNDAVLGAFLESGTVYAHKEQARILAEKIVDPARREKILNSLR